VQVASTTYAPSPAELRALRDGSVALRARSRRLRADSARLHEASHGLYRSPRINDVAASASAQDGLGKR
jgi:hypothetical protein